MVYKDKEKQNEKMRQINREYRQSPKGKKTHTITNWKTKGVIGDYDKLYDIYLNTNECNVCKKDLSTTKKCLDHDHETGEFRYVLCNACNSCDSWKNKITN